MPKQPKPGLTSEQGRFLCGVIESAFESCTEDDPRDHSFVLLVVTRETIDKDGNDMVGVSVLSPWPKETVQAVVSDWLYRSRH